MNKWINEPRQGNQGELDGSDLEIAYLVYGFPLSFSKIASFHI